jgi:hypothetical protein
VCPLALLCSLLYSTHFRHYYFNSPTNPVLIHKKDPTKITFCHSIFSACNLTTPTILCSPLCSINRGPGHWRADCWSHKKEDSSPSTYTLWTTLPRPSDAIVLLQSEQRIQWKSTSTQSVVCSQAKSTSWGNSAPATSALRIVMPHIRLRFDSQEVAYTRTAFCWRYCILLFTVEATADPSGRAIAGVGLRPLACWDGGFESHRGHGCFCCVCCIRTIARNISDIKKERRIQRYKVDQTNKQDEEKKNSRWGHGCLSVVSVVRQRSLRRADHSANRVLPSVGVSECDGEAPIIRKPWPTRGCCTMKKKKLKLYVTTQVSHPQITFY